MSVEAKAAQGRRRLCVWCTARDGFAEASHGGPPRRSLFLGTYTSRLLIAITGGFARAAEVSEPALLFVCFFCCLWSSLPFSHSLFLAVCLLLAGLRLFVVKPLCSWRRLFFGGARAAGPVLCRCSVSRKSRGGTAIAVDAVLSAISSQEGLVCLMSAVLQL